MEKIRILIPPENFSEESFLNDLNARFRLRQEAQISIEKTYFDTFDWRLYNEGLVLENIGKYYYLNALTDDTRIASIALEQPPEFLWDLPDSSLKKTLDPIIEMRALLKLFALNIQSQSIRILNTEQKTVVRLVIEKIAISDANASEVWQHLRLIPLRGYDKQFQSLSAYLTEFRFTPTSDSIYLQTLTLLGKSPGKYSAKLNLQLEPNMRADEAAKIIYRYLLDVMKANEGGIKKDIDTEFLHDFRVSVRRTRSALSQIKDVFPADMTNRFKEEFRFVGRMSNDLRDLDVYLLSADDYRNLLPLALHPDIDPLFEFLKQERGKALKTVIDGLNSEKYHQIIRGWETYINRPPEASPDAANAAIPIIDLAKARIYKRYRAIIKEGKAITDASPDASLHELRIECKKLRYLLEFFSSLFPRHKIQMLVKQLKKLQDNLGRFQDLCIQEESLMQFSNDAEFSGSEHSKTMVAIGCLVGKLDIEKQSVRNTFEERFANFASAENLQLFSELFKNS